MLLENAVMKRLLEISSPPSAPKRLAFNKMVTHNLKAKATIKIAFKMHSDIEDTKCIILNIYL